MVHKIFCRYLIWNLVSIAYGTIFFYYGKYKTIRSSFLHQLKGKLTRVWIIGPKMVNKHGFCYLFLLRGNGTPGPFWQTNYRTKVIKYIFLMRYQIF